LKSNARGTRSGTGEGSGETFYRTTIIPGSRSLLGLLKREGEGMRTETGKKDAEGAAQSGS